MSSTRSQLLRSRSRAFCNAFLEQTSPEKILDQFFTSCPRITEHGPAWANSRLPFMGKTFVGRRPAKESAPLKESNTCDAYFELLSKTLIFEPTEDTFPAEEGFIVDCSAQLAGHDESGAVSVAAHAKFRSVKTGKSWEEQFIYRISDFDKEGRIGYWEIWADPLSAWIAVGGD